MYVRINDFPGDSDDEGRRSWMDLKGYDMSVGHADGRLVGQFNLLKRVDVAPGKLAKYTVSGRVISHVEIDVMKSS